MVKTIKKAGWLRSTCVALALLFGLVASVWTANGHIRGTAKEVVDTEIQIHTAESEVKLEKELGIIKGEQKIQGFKIDLLLQAEGIEVPGD